LRLAKLLLINLICFGQPNYDPSVVLARARDQVLALSDRLPRYTCIQTVNRSYFSGNKKASCDRIAGDKKLGRGKLKLEATDRLRLDVLVTGGREVYAWAGANHFNSKSVDLCGGPIGTGPFGTFLIDIFGQAGVSFQFERSTTLSGKTVLQYAYEVPLEVSHYLTHTEDENWRVTAYRGSLWIDPAAEALERLTVQTSELPPETRACTADTRVDYQRVRLGTGDFLLQLESELHFVLRDGEETNSLSQFSKCREYLAESNLSFADPPPEESTSKPALSPVPLPDGLFVFLALTKPIDTDRVAAGDVISATVTKVVLEPKSQSVLIPAGAVVRGRIVRMEHRFVPSPHFLISINWEQLQLNQGATPFFARINQAFNGDQPKRVTVWLPPRNESSRAGGWFILPTDKDRYIVPAGYTTRWITATALSF
jgi:hypothetical protein